MCNKLLRKKRFLGYTLLLGYLLFMMLIPQYSAASEHPILYLFWGDGCPHCEKEKEFLKFLYKQYPELEMRWFEIWDHPEFAKLADTIREAYGERMTLVPMTFIGDRVIIGFGSYEDTGVQIQEQVKACFEQGCRDALDKFESLPIVKKIKEEAIKKKPEDWMLFPAAPPKQKESEK